MHWAAKFSKRRMEDYKHGATFKEFDSISYKEKRPNNNDFCFIGQEKLKVYEKNFN